MESSTKWAPVGLSVLASIVAFAVSGSAQAASYGDFTGRQGEPSFLNVVDDDGGFGVPSLSADGFSLTFNAPTLGAECSDCPDGGFSNERLSLVIAGDSAYFGFGSLRLSAKVPYSLDSRGFPQDQSFASFISYSDVRVRILEDAGVRIDPIESVYSMVFSPSNNVSVFSGDQLDGMLDGVAVIDIDDILYPALRDGRGDLVGIASRIELEVDFTLGVFQHSPESTLDPSGFARGQLSAFEIEASRCCICLSCDPYPPPPPMPEPSSALLIGLGLMGLATRRGRALRQSE